MTSREEILDWLDKEIAFPLQMIGNDNKVRTVYQIDMLKAIRAELAKGEATIDAESCARRFVWGIYGKK